MTDDNSYVADLFGTRGKIHKAPFAYPGSKTRSLNKLLEILPYNNAFVEPFCGCAIVTMARDESPLEVINDRYSGITDFYKCIQDKKLCEQLIEKIRASIHSREYWDYAKRRWSTKNNVVDRAFLWYYSVRYSFGAIGRTFGRSTRGVNSESGKLIRMIPEFWKYHERLKHVCIENQSWEQIVEDYDHSDAVFYMDPPYLSTTTGQPYKNNMTMEDHKYLVDTIMSMDSYVALSGYKNHLYDSYAWDDVHSWEVSETITPLGGVAHENMHRGKTVEYLYIKEAY